MILQTALSPFHDDPYTEAVFDAFQPVSEEHVRNVILKSAPITCSLDPIPASLFVECLDEPLPAVTHIINSSPFSCVVPLEFATAIVKPFLKKPPLYHTNLKKKKKYRQVTNLSFLSKVLEENKSFCLNSLPAFLPTTCSTPPNQPAVQGTALRRRH